MRPFFLEILLASLLHVRVLEGRQRWARKSKNHEVAEHWGGQEPGQMPNDRVGALAPGAAAATKRRQWTLREEARCPGREMPTSLSSPADGFSCESKQLPILGTFLTFSVSIYDSASPFSVFCQFSQFGHFNFSKLVTAVTQTVQKIGSAQPFINLRSSYWSILDQWEAQSVLQ